jgi:hypothetical protein
LPTPNKGESQKDFISRCIPYVIKEGTAKNREQASAICYSIWRRKHKGEKMGERVLLHLNRRLKTHVDVLNEQGDTEFKVDRTTMLVGDGTYNGVYFPAEEVEKSLFSWNGVPIVYDHSDSVKDAVGDVTEVTYEPASKKLTMKPLIEGYPESENALMYIKARQKAGVVPEVSVGIWADKKMEEIDGVETLVARNLYADHLALVSRGACSPEAGCGVGLKNDSVSVKLEDNKFEQVTDSEQIKKLELQIKIEKERLKEEK